jgi:hypothetical protein
MKRSLTNRATQVLDLLPFAQLLTRRPPSGKLLTAAAFVNSPIAKRLPPRVLKFAKIAVAALAVGSVIAGARQRPGFKWRQR